MVAYKCDRCGSHFDHKGKLTISEVKDHFEDYQLCPACEKDLLCWLHNENVEEQCTIYVDNKPLYSCSKEVMNEILTERGKNI